MSVKLITYSYLKSETDIASETPEESLDNPIRRASDRLRELIGVSFYNELVTQVTGSTLTSDNSSFFDPYVKQFLAWQAYEYWIPRSSVAFTRTGLRVHKEDFSDPVSGDLLGAMIEDARSQTKFYRNTMINFLVSAQKKDSTKYPLYTDQCQDQLPAGFGFSAITKDDDSQDTIDNAYINSEP